MNATRQTAHARLDELLDAKRAAIRAGDEVKASQQVMTFLQDQAIHQRRRSARERESLAYLRLWRAIDNTTKVERESLEGSAT